MKVIILQRAAAPCDSHPTPQGKSWMEPWRILPPENHLGAAGSKVCGVETPGNTGGGDSASKGLVCAAQLQTAAGRTLQRRL